MISLLADRAADKALKLSCTFSADLPEWVTGDSLRLTQILTNLLSNAIKFTHEGEVRLEVSRDAADTCFKVIDSGIGMSEEQVSRLFQPFEQADDSTTRKYGGTGLGLAISYELARLMGGAIQATSQLGAGSSFLLTLTLPVATALTLPEALPPTPGRTLTDIVILVVDDVEANRLVLENLLTGEGAQILLASNGLEALDYLEHVGLSAIDIVLMDVQMPVMDGLDASQRMRAIAPALPVVGVTAHALAEEREKCLAAGMVDVVTKPIDLRTLLETMLRHLPTRNPALAVADAVPPAPTFHAGPVDWSVLLERYKGKQEFVRKLADSVLGSHADTPAKFRQAVQDGNRDALKFMAHSLKGVSGSLEARYLHSLVTAFETDLANETEVPPEQLEAFLLALEAFLAELRQPAPFEGKST